MSSDNAIAVITCNGRFHVGEVSASSLDDEKYLSIVVAESESFIDEEKAWLYARKLNKDYETEYGIVELTYPKPRCEKCNQVLP